MLFNSWPFIGVFLPITVTAYCLLVRIGHIRLAFAFLTLASLAFYGFWNVRFLPLLLGSLTFNYLLGLAIARSEHRMRLGLLVIGICLNLGLLFFFKYALFAQTVVQDLGGSGFGLSSIALPIGLSFISFQKIAYLVDVYSRKPAQQDFLNFALFVTFFPQLIAGPIVHHQEVMPQFSSLRSNVSETAFSVAVTIFILGLAKKVLLADSLSLIAKPVFDAAAQGDVPGLLPAWAALIAYSLQIYFDFSGYSDMAVGLAAMFGIRLPTNFAAPYRSTSIIDFWGRWHITLSRFLRDYLYIPLGGNRVGEPRRYLNIFITMLLGGIWHGAGWTFVLWGALHGGLITLNHAWRTWRAPPLPSSVGWALTFLTVSLAWVPFRSKDLGSTWRMYEGLAGGAGWPNLLWSDVIKFFQTIAYYVAGLGPSGQINPIAVVIALPLALLIVFALPDIPYIFGRAYPGLQTPSYPEQAVPPMVLPSSATRWKPTVIWAAAAATIAAISLLKLNDVSEFIYFQF